MKKYVLMPVGLNQEIPKPPSTLPEVPKLPNVFPISKKEELKERIRGYNEDLHRTFADPRLTASEKLRRQGELLQAYKEAYAELNKPTFLPPFSNEYVGPLPREEKEEEDEGEVNRFLASLMAKKEEEEDDEEEEQKTMNASRIMNILSPTGRIFQPSHTGRASLGSNAPFATPPDVIEQLNPTPKGRAKPPRYQAPTLASLREPRSNAGKKPKRFGFGKQGLIRRPRPYVAKS